MTQLSLLRRPPEPLTAADHERRRSLAREITAAHMRLGRAHAARDEAEAMGYSTGARVAAGAECDRAAAHLAALEREMADIRRRASLGGGR